ncbi:MAG TPA: NAD-dependent epimerase/dehydratase family protein [Bryobacteraceae bacterium]|nr:NAD-dependent epimerase/dehydratase family protein [Bryobacteraceae bacterium]
MTVAILGCGYTGRRLARGLLSLGVRVVCTSRNPEGLHDLQEAGAEVARLDLSLEPRLDILPFGSFVVQSIPPVEGANPRELWDRLVMRKPQRVVYLSTTGVYGDQRDVDEHSSPAPRHERDQERLREEAAALAGPWSSIVLRPAAIYGPARGIHESMAKGKFRLVGNGENYVSRIHVEDLAAHVQAAIRTDVGGAWPVADEHPCTSREIAEYCSELMGVPIPVRISADEAHHTRRADRRVDGRGIRRELGVELKYPSYRAGIPASLK